MLEEIYGTRPDLLPRSMVKVAWAEQSGGRGPVWVGRSGVELLGSDDHLEYERASLGRFARGSDGAIDWSRVPSNLVLFSSRAESGDLDGVLQRYVSESPLIFLWDSLAIPTVRLSMEAGIAQLSAVTERIAEFWIYSPGDTIVLECAFSGAVTVACVP